MSTDRNNGKDKAQYQPAIIIANPMYDTVFKKLMENERIAKFFLSTILEQQVVSLDIRPQEYTYKSDPDLKKTGKRKRPEPEHNIGYSIFRIDFMATIITATGEKKKILIEVQKSYDEEDLMRFRNYLAEQYKKIDKVNGVDIVLPITTIYIIGFELEGIQSPCIRVERMYVDMVYNKLIETKAAFIEKLTHNSYVIQTKKITDERYSTKLDKLLSVFEQKNFAYANSEIGKFYSHPSEEEDIQVMTSLLNKMIVDPEERAEIEKEEEALRIIDDLFGKKNREQKKALEEAEKALKKERKAREEERKAREEERKAREEKEKELEEERKALKEERKAREEERKAREEKEKELEELKRSLNIS